jgi:type II restriction/modification system DNA methylase subunit YeeA
MMCDLFNGEHGVGNDPEYVHTEIFETFPFPEGLSPNLMATEYADDPTAQSIAAAAARLNELRENWLKPPDLVDRVPEVVPGYPDRVLPKSAVAAAELKKRTLTNLYNARPAWLATPTAHSMRQWLKPTAGVTTGGRAS